MYKEILEQFNRNIIGLRDFVELIGPMLDEYHKKENEKHHSAFDPLVLAHQIKQSKNSEEKSELEEKLNDIFDGEIEVNTAEESTSDSEESSRKLSFSIKGDTSKIDAAVEFHIKSTDQQNLLYFNSLVNLLSSAEWFYSQLLHFFYDQNPHSSGIKKKTLTLEELKSFGSVEDAEKYLIDSKIEGLIRSSFSDWMDNLKSEIGLGLGYLKEFKEELVEIYQRRNLLVHNGGIVNTIYLSKVKNSTFDVGSKISVDEEYLDNAIDKVHVLFSLIACELWKKESIDDEDRCSFLMDMSYEYLKQGKWIIAKIPNTFIVKDAGQRTIPKTYAQLNCWLCDKRLNGLESVQNSLKDIDFSDKTVVIQLAFSALIEDEESFFDLLPKALNSEELSVKYLFDFPILQEMRSLDKFHEFSTSNALVSEYLENEKKSNMPNSA